MACTQTHSEIRSRQINCSLRVYSLMVKLRSNSFYVVLSTFLAKEFWIRRQIDQLNHITSNVELLELSSFDHMIEKAAECHRLSIFHCPSSISIHAIPQVHTFTEQIRNSENVFMETLVCTHRFSMLCGCCHIVGHLSQSSNKRN